MYTLWAQFPASCLAYSAAPCFVSRCTGLIGYVVYTITLDNVADRLGIWWNDGTITVRNETYSIV